ncbi:MAG: SPFH domain-containing protein [Candidatus Peribacteraceae bacterium]|nr:SPFH domain-containing protein [Candidatus Peribacteraceae bacterium]
MILIVLGFILLMAAIGVWKLMPAELNGKGTKWYKAGTSTVLSIAAICVFAMTSYVDIPLEPTPQLGIMKKIYGFTELPQGSVVAINGEKGIQGKTLTPGFHIIPFVNVIFKIEPVNFVTIPPGKVGIITTRDGKMFEDGQFIARPWPNDVNMLDVETFMKNDGQKGVQMDVLRPGTYPLNTYFYQVEIQNAINIPKGYVGVVKSNVGPRTEECLSDKIKNSETVLAVPLVKKGCFGVWDEALLPGAYYMNQRAYVITQITTQMVNLTYKGDYTKREIQVTISEDGSIVQHSKDTPVAKPEGAVEGAVEVQSKDKWKFPVEIRVQGQVTPEDAPIMVAGVGSIDKVEDIIITPVLRSVLRNESQKYLASEYIDNREDIESASEVVVATEAKKAGFTVTDLRMGDPNVPPELRITGIMEDLAKKMSKTYESVRKAQHERIAAEKEKGMATQQHILAKAEIEMTASKMYITKRTNEAKADRRYLEELARGQAAVAKVLGDELTYQLELAKIIMEAVGENPEIVQYPVTYVGGGESSLEGAAAVFGTSNLASVLGGAKGMRIPK